MNASTTWEAGTEPVPFHPNVTTDVVEVWRDDRDLLWRWRYLGHDGTELLGNRSSPSREAAVEAAGVAYPGLLIRDRPAPPPRPAHRVRTAVMIVLILFVVLTAGLGLLLVAALFGAAVALRARSVRRHGESG